MNTIDNFACAALVLLSRLPNITEKKHTHKQWAESIAKQSFMVARAMMRERIKAENEPKN